MYWQWFVTEWNKTLCEPITDTRLQYDTEIVFYA